MMLVSIFDRDGGRSVKQYLKETLGYSICISVRNLSNTLFSKNPTSRISFIPGNFARADTWWAIIGRPAMGNKGFGQSMERGLKRVPDVGPPTRITPLSDDAMLICNEKIFMDFYEKQMMGQKDADRMCALHMADGRPKPKHNACESPVHAVTTTCMRASFSRHFSAFFPS